MQTKSFFLTAILFFSVSLLFAQTVDLKKDEVFLDDKKIFNYKIVSWSVYELHLSSIETNKEVIMISRRDNETPKFYDDDFVQIKFLQLGKSLELKSTKTWKKFILWLLENEVIDNAGNISEPKVDLFIKNFDEHITSRTVR
jgi:hypothetical protein